MSFWEDVLSPEVVRAFRRAFSRKRERRPVLERSAVTSSNWKQAFGPSARDREDKEMRGLYREAKRAYSRSPFADKDASGDFIFDLITDICAEHGMAPAIPLGNALWDAIAEFLISEGLAIEVEVDEPPPHLTIEERVQMRAILRRHLAFLEDHDRLLPIWRRKLLVLFAGVLGHFPPSVFADVDAEGAALDDAILLPTVAARDLCEHLPECIDRSIVTFFDEDITNAHLFEGMRERLERNVGVASGIAPGDHGSTKQPIWPTEHKNQDPQFLLDAYLGGTALHDFFDAEFPFAIPFPARFEHTHVIGGTGHGKTQLLQFLIHHDLTRAKEDRRSVVVIDSQGDLIRTVSNLHHFSPSEAGGLSDRYVMIDPADVEHPVALNMFDFNRSRLSGYGPVDREKILNATIELYEYFFGALLGAELTQRQGLIFRYLARLLVEIPGATIHTLRELMEDGQKFLPYMEKLTGTTRSFFATRFFDRSFNETKKQILARLWGVLGNSALERMFSHKDSKVDVFDLLNSGKIVFINTAKDLLGQEGAAIFGRFFIALIVQAAVQRAAIPAHERNSAFVYIDEAQDYFDSNISSLLAQARKYRIGLVFAHQSLDQLGTELRGSVLANTTIKFAGGVSAKDASALARDLRCESEFLLGQSRSTTETHFACYVRNYTRRALSITVPLGFVESQEQLSASEANELREKNREAYSAPPEPVPDAEFRVTQTGTDRPAAKKAQPKRPPEARREEPEPPEARPPSPPRPAPSSTPHEEPPLPIPQRGRGGQEHKYLQHVVKGLAEECGFRASIEETILGGSGQVDVSLSKGKRRIACEISVTTGGDHELQNVEKCIAAGYTEILLVGKTERHVKTLATFIERNLDEGHGADIRYASRETLAEFFAPLRESEGTGEATVRGYKVKTVRQVLSPEERAARRRAISDVIVKSLQRSKE